jgi:PadR family transcriptional regulator PadR
MVRSVFVKAHSTDYLENYYMSDERYEPELTLRSEASSNSIVPRPINWLVPVTLLMLRQWNSYGYELINRTVELGFETMNPGTLYRTLRKMEKDGLCESEWETASGGPARRIYSITSDGEAYLNLWATSLKQYQQTMDGFLQAYRNGVGQESKQPKA